MRICNEFAGYLKQEGIDCTKEQGSIAAIINLVDVAGVKPWGEYSPYCASRSGRFGQPKDITRTIEFLLNNDYITGQVLCIDGGRGI